MVYSSQRSTSTRVRIPTLLEMAERGEPIAAVTAYDAIFGRMVDEAGVDVVLVGDSLGMVVQGHDTTLPVTVNDVVYHCRAVARGVRRAHLVADLPFLSYQVGEDDAVRNAGRLLQEGGAHAVKLEGGLAMCSVIRRLVESGIPVMGHVGLLPQHVHAMGGFKKQGKSAEDAERVLRDAEAVVEAGVYAIVLEGIPAELAARITSTVRVPTIGIGAGPHCSGQILVSHDLLGLSPGPVPSFVRTYERLYARGLDALQTYVAEVRSGAFPARPATEGASRPPSSVSRAR